MNQQTIPFVPTRWSVGVKIISVGWTVLLFCAWVRGEVTAVSLLACGVVPGALYWTIASLLHHLGECEPTATRHMERQ